MIKRVKYKWGLTGNTLKLISLVAMTIDHIGCEIFPGVLLLRIIGRLAFPIFAYMIAEGCTYTKNRKKHLLTIAILALVCQIVYFFAMHSLYQCILVTFALSIALIYAIDNAVKNKTFFSTFAAVSVAAAIFFTTYLLPLFTKGSGFEVDYGILGVLLPVFVYFSKERFQKLAVFAVGVSLVSICYSGIQWFSMLTIPFIALYNGKRGKLNIKYLFYTYYPLHMVIIYLIGIMV